MRYEISSQFASEFKDFLFSIRGEVSFPCEAPKKQNWVSLDIFHSISLLQSKKKTLFQDPPKKNRKVHRKKRLSTHSLIVLKKIDQCQSHFFRLFISAFKLSCCACNIKEWKLCQIETWFLHFPPDLLWQFRMNDLGLQQQFFLILHWNKK